MKSKKRKAKQITSDSPKTENKNAIPAVVSSDEPVKKKSKWVNKERVMVFASRGISYRDRHLMKDFRGMMPHSKSETKMDRKDKLFIVNEICEMKNCQKCIYFESKKKLDLYMWVANIPHGPSAKFLVENVHTMMELKMTGNCLKGSRPLLTFDSTFDSEPHWKLLRELFIQTFGTPNHHPKSQPFFDHVYTFAIADERIWFRNYQIIEENGELAEIGPRLVLNPIKIFKGSFGGVTLFDNPFYETPNAVRQLAKLKAGTKFQERISQKVLLEKRRLTHNTPYRKEITDDVFNTD